MSYSLKNLIMMLKGALRGNLGVTGTIASYAVFAFVLVPSYAGAATVTETFEGFSCPGAWVARPPGPNGTQSYVRNCGNGWAAFAEDTNDATSDPPSPGSIGNQNVIVLDSTANGPSVASATDAAGLINATPSESSEGVLWLLKSYPIQPGAVINPLKADVRLKLSNTTLPDWYGIVVFAGVVTDPSGPVDANTRLPTRADVLGGQVIKSNTGSACSGVTGGDWCAWQTIDIGGNVATSSTSTSYITVGFRVEDGWGNHSSFGEVDNISIGGVTTEAGSPLAATDIAQRWQSTYSAPGTDNMAEAVDVVLDTSPGNSYVTGNTYLNGRTVVVTNEYDDTGVLQWSQIYGGGVANYAIAMARGPAGNLYILSRRYNAAGDYDYAVIKYAPTGGSYIWQSVYNNTGHNDVPTGLAADSSGVYVTGSTCSSAASCDYATIKLDSTDGTQLWVKTYDGSGLDKTADVKLDTGGNVYVTGTSTGLSDDVVTIKYDSDGNQLWEKRYDSGRSEQATAFAVDGAGNSYIAAGLGYSGGIPAILALKYDGNGVLQWAKTYNGSAYGTLPSALVIDGDGNVYITGKTGRVTDHDIVTVKFDGDDGTIVWAHSFGNAGLDDWGVDVAVDADGYTFVLGNLTQNVGNSNFVTVKYDPAGNAVSAIAYDGFTLKDTAVALALGVDSQGDTVPYVTGTSADLNGLDKITTVRYEKSRPDLKPTAINGPSTAVVGDSISVSDTVQNIDSIPLKKHADSGAFDVGFYLAPGTSGLPDLNNLISLDTTRNVSNLTPGQSSSASTVVTVPNVAEGQYYFVSKADLSGAVTEQDEANNIFAASAPIAITSDKPDLTVTNFSGPGSISRDNAFNVNVAVQNIASPAAGAFRIGIYLSTDTTIDGSDVLIGQQGVGGGLGGLGSGLENYSATISATVSSNPSAPNYAATGANYYLGVMVDDLNAVDEANEDNNTAVGQGIGHNTLLTTREDFMVDGVNQVGISEIGVGVNAHMQLGHQTYAWSFNSAWDAPDVGNYAAPWLADLNGDQKLDLLIGDRDGTTYGYENIGSLSSPSWQANTSWNVAMPTTPCSGLTAAPTNYPRPTVADMNGDGIPDLLLIGYHNGICAFQNSGDTVPPTWVRQSVWDVPSGTYPTRPPLLHTYNSPALGDLDNDGLPDLLLGQSSDVRVRAYKNTGTNTAPAWTYMPTWNYALTDTYVAPATVDMNGDFTTDFFYGKSNDNTVKAVANYGGGFYVPTWHDAPALNVPAASDTYLVPTFGDLNNDGRIDVMVGGSYGVTFGVRNIGAYATSGVYTSKVVDSGTHGSFTTLSYATSKPTGTTLTVDIRAGDSTTAGDSTWTPWLTDIASGGDISFLGTHRYIQYRANLATTDTSLTPALYSIQAFYQTLPATAVPVSVSVADNGSGGGELSVMDLLALGLLALYGRRYTRRVIH